MGELPQQPSGQVESKSQNLLVALVFGPVAVVIVGSRWLSQVPVGPIFVYDVLMAVTCGLALGFLIHRRREVSRRRYIASSVLLVFPLIATLQLVRSGFSLEALREFAPYLYLVFGWVVFLLVPFLSATSLRRGFHVIGGALGVHFLWAVAVRRVPGVEPLGLGDVTVFGLRPDIDSTLTGVFAAYLLVLAITVNTRVTVQLALLASAILIGLDAATFGTRAGHLAAVAALGGVVIHAVIAHWGNRTRLLIATAAATTVTVTSAAVPLAFSNLAEGYIGALNVVSPPKQPSALVSGTARARWASWEQLLDWIFVEPSRWAQGVGFGTGYMEESGALVKLLGPLEGLDTEGVGPHNFLLFVLATMGIFFLIGFCALIVFALLRGVLAFRGESAQTFALAFSLALGLIVSSIFGVVFEAPHGAIPLAWALGFLLSAGWLREAESPHRKKSKKVAPALISG